MDLKQENWGQTTMLHGKSTPNLLFIPSFLSPVSGPSLIQLGLTLPLSYLDSTNLTRTCAPWKLKTFSAEPATARERSAHSYSKSSSVSRSSRIQSTMRNLAAHKTRIYTPRNLVSRIFIPSFSTSMVLPNMAGVSFISHLYAAWPNRSMHAK